MSVFRRGNSFYFDFWERGERYAGRIGPVNRTVAGDIERKIRADVVAGKHLPSKRQDRMFDKWADEFIKIKEGDPAVKPRTVTRYEGAMDHLKAAFSGKALGDLSSFIVKKYMKDRLAEEKGPTKATVNREIACLRHCLNLAVDRGLLSSNPLTRPGDRVRLLKEDNARVRYLTEAEEGRLLAACNSQLRPLVLTATHTGGRASELLGLKWTDVNFDKRTIRFLASYSKSGETRTVPISDTLYAELESLKLSQDPPSDSVFCSRDGLPYKSYRTAFATACRNAKIEDFHFHDCRHSFASKLIMRGVDLVTVKELLGHKNITMTLRYSHLSHEHKQRAVAVLDQPKTGREVPSNFPTTQKRPLEVKSLNIG